MKKEINKKNRNLNGNRIVSILMLLMCTFALVGCGKEEELTSWNNVAGESLTVEVTDAEIEETVEMINAEDEANEEKLEVLNVNEAEAEIDDTIIEESNVEELSEEESNTEETETMAEESFLMSDLTFEASIDENEDESIHATFQIFDGNGKTIQVIENDPFFTKDWFEAFKESSCYFSDFNFDGYLDVTTIGSSGYVNAYNFVYLWDIEQEQFVFSTEASDIANAVIHEEKKQIISVSRDVGLPIYRLYEVKDGKITLVAEIIEALDDNLNIICTETIFETGQVTIVTERDQLNEIWDGYNIELYN